MRAEHVGAMSAADRELFGGAVERAVAASIGAAGLDAALADIGWADALAVDERAAVSVLFEAQGAAGVTSGALDAVLLAGLGLTMDTRTSVVLPALTATGVPGSVRSGMCVVQGLATGAFAGSERVLVVSDDPTAPGTVAVAVPTGLLHAHLIEGLDPRFALHGIDGSASIESALVGPLHDVAWDAAVAAGRRALAYELVGGSRAMLELARVHALERVQFGRPIAAFQAVRHRLSESLVAIEAAAALADATWDDSTDVHVAAMAKSLAGRSALTVARHCQQILAGIGFTAEHQFHLLFRRVVLLDQLLGSSDLLARTLGRDMLASRTLPTPLPL